MIFAVDFGQAQTGVGYQFMDGAGNLLGVRSISVSPGSQPGMYFVQVGPPSTAISIFWDCNEGITARDDFQELLRLETLAGGTVPPPVSISYPFQIPGSLSEELDGDLGEAIPTFEQTFFWKGRRIAAVINYRLSRVLTLKSFFGAAGARVYPKCGQTVLIAGAKYQITRKGNAQIKAVTGGFIEDPAFIDDPTNPSLEIEYSRFVTK
jgi:hypothetical protein